MDTLSIIKLLSENKTLKATNGNMLGCSSLGTEFICSNTIGWYKDELCWLKKDYTYFGAFNIKSHILEMQWEIVKEPVDFMIAINSGLKIKGNGFSEYHFLSWYIQSRSLTLENINGNWYIED